MLQMSDSMLAALWTVTPALMTASIMILAVWLVLIAHAGGAARLAQLEVAAQKHAYILSELQTSLHTDRPPPQQQQQVHRLAGKVERLDMQLAELCTQVQADDQARELLSRLSGVIADLRTQLQVSIQNSAQVALHSTDIEAFKTQLSSCTTDHAELKRQAAVLSQLKRHMDPSTKRQLELTRQASILDDLKAQLSMSNDLSVELMFSRTSLEEARALMAQALKSQAHHVESTAAGTHSLNPTHPASDQKAGYWLKPKPAQMRHRASVAFPSAEWESPPKRSAELNADITQLGENTRSVSELGDSGAESPSRRSFVSSPSGAVLSPFASQLYQVPSDLKKQLEAEDGGNNRQGDKDSASGGSDTELDFALGGLPICRSLSRKITVPKRRPPLQAHSPPRSHSPRQSLPSRVRRLSDSRLSMDSRPFASTEDIRSLHAEQQQPKGVKDVGSGQALVTKPSAKFLKAFSGAKGFMPSYSRKPTATL